MEASILQTPGSKKVALQNVCMYLSVCVSFYISSVFWANINHDKIENQPLFWLTNSEIILKFSEKKKHFSGIWQIWVNIGLNPVTILYKAHSQNIYPTC